MANTLKFGNGEWYGKKDTILAYNDENNNYKPLPFDFSRDGLATVVNKDGLIETVGSGEPRIDYKDNTKGALLLEPSRSNRFLYSEDYTNSAWTTFASGETIVSNSIISPDGTLNADTLEGDGTATNVYVRQNVTLTTSTDYTFSIFAKKGTNDFLAISAEGFSGATNTLVIFDLNNSIVTNGTGNIKDYGNGWLRCSFTTAISTDGTGRFLIYPAYNGTTRGFPTSSDANGKNIYIYGAQLEEGSYPTSYIPTQGGVVTRLADSCSQTAPDGVIGQTEGTMYVEMNFKNNSSDFVNIFLWNGSTANRVFISRRGNNKFMQFQMSKTGETTRNLNGSDFIDIGLHKIAVSYSSDKLAGYLDGVKVGEITTGNFSYNGELSELLITTSNSAERVIKDLKLYNEALTDQQLIELTTI